MSEHYFTNQPQSEHDLKELLYRVPKSDISLKLTTDAGVFSRFRIDFGSDLLIASCQPAEGSSVLDLGCGYGVVGLSLLARGEDLLLMMSDVNQRAVDLARQNALHNNLNAEVEVSDGFGSIGGRFDYILLNPPIRAGKAVYYKMVADSIDYLHDHGELWIVVRKRQGGQTLMNHMKAVFDNCVKVNRSGGYWILKSVRNSH